MDARARAHVDAAVQRMLVRVAAAIVRDAKRFVPVDTGRLRDGIKARPPIGKTVRIVSSRVDPAGGREGVPVYVELGTRHMAPQPYLKPALFRKRAI